MKEGVEGGGKDAKIEVGEYDEWEGYDMDGEGVYNEREGIIEEVMVVDGGVGEEGGGGEVGSAGIWWDRWSLGDV
ncbi:immune inhibitor A domain-containing protein, partial [Bacillus altitudinis]|uniref:immune inhibitor A domain-containing protein n=1 Tax=Bacillus altitudinis TaxID=293387 RepID=UPI00235726A8